MRRRSICGWVLVAVGLAVGSPDSAGAAGFARVTPSPGVWDQLFAGVRSESMGQADLAAGTGPFAVLDNPAPLLTGTAPGAGLTAVGYGQMDYIAGMYLRQYGLAYERRPFRLSAARLDLGSDPMPDRTAYLPEGTGETFRIDDRMIVLAACLDVAAVLAPRSAWEWTFGLGHRRYRYGLADDTLNLWGMDLGTSARHHRQLAGGSVAYSVAGVIRNVGARERLPYTMRIGAALALGLDSGGTADAVKLTVAATWVDDMSDGDYLAGHHYGAEITLWRVLSARLGRDDRSFDGATTYGFGLRLPDRWLSPVGLAIDWGSVDLSDVMAGEFSSEMISVTGSLRI